MLKEQLGQPSCHSGPNMKWYTISWLRPWSLALIGSASGRFWGERDLESEAFSMRRLGGSRWCLRRTRCALGFERQLVAESITGRAVANWNGVVVIVERIAGASRGVHGPGCGNVSPWGRHTNALACRSTSPGR